MADTCEKLSPACMMCPRVTGAQTCFPEPCVFYRERNIEGTKSYAVMMLYRARNGKGRVYASQPKEQPNG